MELHFIIIEGEKRDGSASFWNSPWHLQEIVYRGGKPHKILWLMRSIEDNLASGKYGNADISIPMLKSGNRSVSDVFLQSLNLKTHLLGDWLDQMGFPDYIKSKCRAIFQNHTTYRIQWRPIDDDLVIDTTWVFSWPKAGKDLIDFLELCIYKPGALPSSPSALSSFE